ncbi:hypothetical protein Tco_1428396 [Tanacetum coccineum]
MRTASAAAKPCQGDSLEFYLITRSIYTDQRGTVLLTIDAADYRRDFRYSDTERLSRNDEVLKLKNFKKDAALKLFKSTNKERYKHVGPKVTSSQDGKVAANDWYEVREVAASDWYEVVCGRSDGQWECATCTR